MSERPPLTCTTCGVGCWNWEPTMWLDDNPYCSSDCLSLVHAVEHAIPSPVDRAIERDHSLCGAEPCTDCR